MNDDIWTAHKVWRLFVGMLGSDQTWKKAVGVLHLSMKLIGERSLYSSFSAG